MNDEQLLLDEMRAIDASIDALRAVAHQHGMQEEHYDPDWMDSLDTMILRLRHRTDDCYRTRRAMFGPAVPVRSL